MLSNNELLWRTATQLLPIGLPPTALPRPFVSSKASTSPAQRQPPAFGVPVYPSSVMAAAAGGGGSGGTPNSDDRRRGRDRQRFESTSTLGNMNKYGGGVSASYVPFVADAKEAWKSPGTVDPFATKYDTIPQPQPQAQPRSSSQPRQPPSSSSSLSSTSSSSMPSKPYSSSRAASTSPSRGSSTHYSNGSGNKAMASSSSGGGASNVSMNTNSGEVPLKAIKEALEAAGYKQVITFRAGIHGDLPCITFSRPAREHYPSQSATLTFPNDFPDNRAQMKIDGKRDIQPVYYRPTAPNRHVSPTEFVKAISLIV